MESRSAVEKYAEKKRSHLDTARKCNEVGIVFQPIVFDAQGGMTMEASVVIHQLAKTLAQVENRQLADCKQEILQRFAVIIARANSTAIRRRASERAQSHVIPCKRAYDESRFLQEAL